MALRWLWVTGGGIIGLLGLGNQLAIAQPRGFEGSYLGATVDGSNVGEGLESLLGTGSSRSWVGDQVEGSSSRSGSAGQRNLQTRIDVQDSPISIRGAIVLGDEIEAAMPMLSYDVPLGNSANIYAGAGYALVRPGAQTALGDRDGVVLTTGIEAAVNRTVVIYGDVRFHPTNTTDTNPVRAQFGLGHRF